MADDNILGTIGNIAGAAAPVAAAINPVAGLVLGLANSLISAFSPLAKEKIAKEINRHTNDPNVGAQVADAVIAKAKELTAKPDPVEAYTAAKSNAEIMGQLETQALDTLDRMAPFLDKLHAYSRDEWAANQASMDAAAARARADPRDRDGLLTWAILIMVGIVMLALGAGMVAQAIRGQPFGELLTMFGTVLGVIVAKFGTRYDHRYGSSNGSAAKDATINQLSRVR